MLKKFLLFTLITMSTNSIMAQDSEMENATSDFGFTSGIMESRFDLANVGQIKEIYNPGEHDGFGMFLGLFHDTSFNEDFGLYSELIWAKLDDSNRYLLSSALKYRIFQSGFHALGGLELNYLGSAPKNELGEENVKQAGLNGLLGIEYQVTTRFSIYGNISFEVTNRLKGDDGASNHGYHNGRLGLKFKI